MKRINERTLFNPVIKESCIAFEVDGQTRYELTYKTVELLGGPFGEATVEYTYDQFIKDLVPCQK